MRKVLALLLLTSISFQVMGYSIVCHSSIYWQKKEMKKRIKLGLPASELHKFEFSREAYEELHWEEEEKEFSLNGHLFDVVYKKELHDGIQLKCINDKQEEILFAHLDEQVSFFLDVQNKGNAKTKHLLKLVKIQAYLVFLEFDLHATSKANNYPSFFSKSPKSIHQGCFIPPKGIA